MMTSVNMVHVSYRGGAPALADLLGGQLQVMFANMLEHCCPVDGAYDFSIALQDKGF